MINKCEYLIAKLKGAYSEEELKAVEPLCKNNHIFKKIMYLWTIGNQNVNKRELYTFLSSIEDPGMVRIDKAGK